MVFFVGVGVFLVCVFLFVFGMPRTRRSSGRRSRKGGRMHRVKRSRRRCSTTIHRSVRRLNHRKGGHPPPLPSLAFPRPESIPSLNELRGKYFENIGVLIPAPAQLYPSNVHTIKTDTGDIEIELDANTWSVIQPAVTATRKRYETPLSLIRKQIIQRATQYLHKELNALL